MHMHSSIFQIVNLVPNKTRTVNKLSSPLCLAFDTLKLCNLTRTFKKKATDRRKALASFYKHHRSRPTLETPYLIFIASDNKSSYLAWFLCTPPKALNITLQETAISCCFCYPCLLPATPALINDYDVQWTRSAICLVNLSTSWHIYQL